MDLCFTFDMFRCIGLSSCGIISYTYIIHTSLIKEDNKQFVMLIKKQLDSNSQ